MALRRRLAGGAAAAALAAVLGLAWAGWVEPYRLLHTDRVRLAVLPGASGSFRIVHLADLHVRAGGPQRAALDRLAAAVAAARPDLVAVSGDLWEDGAAAPRVAANVAAAAAFAARLRALAPLVAVQGHADHLGTGVALLRRAGVEWLDNESRLVATPAGPFLLAGLSQQAGYDELVPDRSGPPGRFVPLPPGGPGEPPAWRAEPSARGRNVYLHYDPAVAAATGPADPAGPLSWSGYTAVVETVVDGEDAGAGLVVHSRRPLGEDRMLRLRRVGPAAGEDGSFVLVAHGSAFTAGRPDTGVVPRPGAWYRLRVATRVEPGVVRVAARAWPAGEPEPAAWQAWAEDRSPGRVTAGTVGLWGWGGGARYRGLEVRRGDGAIVAPRPGGPGWRTATRASRLALALAKAPPAPPGTPVVVLAHSPDAAPEAAWRGVEAVLAGHTHGGQIALPGFGALTTRTALGRHYDAGTFHFAAFNPRGWTTLYVNPGFGTTFLPLRFAVPPRLAVVDLTPRAR